MNKYFVNKIKYIYFSFYFLFDLILKLIQKNMINLKYMYLICYQNVIKKHLEKIFSLDIKNLIRFLSVTVFLNEINNYFSLVNLYLNEFKYKLIDYSKHLKNIA